MAAIGETLKHAKIDDIESYVYQIGSEIGREFDKVSNEDGLKLIMSLLKMRFEVDFSRFNMHEMEQKALVAIFCSKYSVVHEDGEYSLELYPSAQDAFAVDLGDEESYKLNVVDLENQFNNYSEDFQFICDSLRISRPWWIPPSSIRPESLLKWRCEEG